VEIKLAAEMQPPAGVFAAIAEDPEFIAPLRAFRGEMRAVFQSCPEPDKAELVYLACEGLVHERLTDAQATEERRLSPLFAMLHRLLG
jgi:Tetracyclin repressor-like, C-terminal domain